jgi:antitoxin YobK
MSKVEIERLINENIDTGLFTGGIKESLIKEIEKELQVTLPKSYKWFLCNYGSGGIFGVDIIGVGKLNQNIVVTDTKKARDLGLDKDLVIIEDCDEFMYCLDTSELSNGECPVVSWDNHSGYDSVEANNFYEFLLERLTDAKDAWEEDF